LRAVLLVAAGVAVVVRCRREERRRLAAEAPRQRFIRTKVIAHAAIAARIPTVIMKCRSGCVLRPVDRNVVRVVVVLLPGCGFGRLRPWRFGVPHPSVTLLRLIPLLRLGTLLGVSIVRRGPIQAGRRSGVESITLRVIVVLPVRVALADQAGKLGKGIGRAFTLRRRLGFARKRVAAAIGTEDVVGHGTRLDQPFLNRRCYMPNGLVSLSHLVWRLDSKQREP
jgi:hypothetical protein